MTLDQAKSLTKYNHVHYTGKHQCTRTIGPRGKVTDSITNCRVNGEPKTWKRSPERVQVPVKYGMYDFAYITEDDLDDWHLAEECPLNQ